MSYPRHRRKDDPAAPSVEGHEGGRRLAALMFTDMVGFSALVHADERLAKSVVEEMYRIVRDSTMRFSGREMDIAGDGFFMEFPSAVSAIDCAYEIQARIHEHNLGRPREQQFQIRIGLHIGDFVEVNGHVLGDDVNIAARLEKLAPPGGIAVSRQLADQVAGKFQGSFKSLGHIGLKNIAKKVHVHGVELPWTRKSGAVAKGIFIRRIGQLTPWFGVFGLSVVSLLVGAYFTRLVLDYIHIDRGPTIRMETGWEIQLAPGQPWEPFDSIHGMSSRAFGDYRMRKSFGVEPDQVPVEPALVLGTIHDRYRIFLNGKLIGGANRSSPVEYFTFDRGLFRTEPGSENQIEIQARTASGFSPGIYVLPQIGAFIGEFHHVYSTVIRDRVLFHARQVTVFSLSFFLLLITLFAWLLNPFDRKRAYNGLYIFFCTMLCSHYLAAVFSGHPFWVSSLFGFIPPIVLPQLMVSAYLAARGAKRLEVTNNLFLFCGTAALVAYLMSATDSPARFFAIRPLGNWFSAIYGVGSAAWIGYSAVFTYKDKGLTKVVLAGSSATVFNVITSVFAVLSVPFLFPKSWDSVRAVMYQVSMGFPLVFGFFLGIEAVLDYSRQRRQLHRRQAVLSMSRRFLSLLVEGGSVSARLAKIQSLVCENVGAEKSTVLLKESLADGTFQLRAAAVVRNREHRGTALEAPFSPNEGVLGYVCDRRTPILVEDLSRDARFSALFRDRPRHQYYTNSCMLFPLVHNSQFVGVLTLADHKDGRPFDQQDFEIAAFSANIIRALIQLGGIEDKASAVHDVVANGDLPRVS